MADLFYGLGTSFPEQIELLKQDLYKDAKLKGYKGKKKIKILYGEEKHIDNNILIVHPAYSGPDYFCGDEFSAPIELMNKLEMFNHFVTYANPIPFAKQTRDTIKNFRPWMYNLVDIIRPKLIVVLGEDAQFVFFTKKSLLLDYHGLIIGNYNSIPVMSSYEFAYYATQSAYEDRTYKKYIQNYDWQLIKTEYTRRIKCL